MGTKPEMDVKRNREMVTTIEFHAAQLQSRSARRRFLGELAVAAGALALVPLILRGRLGTALSAQGADFPATTGWAECEDLTDFQILNYALVLEYLEATFYLRAEGGGQLPRGATVDQIDPDGGGAPGRVRGLSSTRPPKPATFNVKQLVRTVRNHEIEHVLFLQNALGNLALPRSAFEFVFPGAFDSPEAFLAVAQTLEDVGVTAYLGQVGNIDDTGILAAAGSIALVEGEHAAAFRLVNRNPLTPNNASFDMRRKSSEVLALADPFITSPDPLPDPDTFPT